MGMSEGDLPPVDPARLTPSMFVGDVIAGHGETASIRAAKQAGCLTDNGDQMVAAVQQMLVQYFLRT